MLDILTLPPTVLAAIGSLFLAVSLAVAGLAGIFDRGTNTRRLNETSTSAQGGRRLAALRKALKPLEEKITPRQEKDLSHIRKRLVRAGFYDRRSVGVYFLARLGLAAILSTAFALLAPVLSNSVSMRHLLIGTLGLAAIGYILPSLVMDHLASKRKVTIGRGFPDALDLLLVCVEAGLGLDAAINRVADEIGAAHPLLREHFRLMSIELQTGKSRDDALRSFADRIGLDEVDALATLLIQSDSLGASIADTLRALSDDMRSKRMLMSEEKAQQVGVKLTFPLILMIMPALMLTVGTPAILQLMRKVGPVLSRFGG